MDAIDDTVTVNAADTTPIDAGFCVLALNEAHLRADSGDRGNDLWIDLSLAAGETLLVHATRPRQGSLLADACAGVVTPTAGQALFMGHDWQQLDAEDSNALRSLMGRVFSTNNWFDHLDMVDNILLPHLHHTTSPREQLLEDAARLARRFGLPGLPRGLHLDLTPAESRRAACVRAFLGSPRLIVLESPTDGAYPELVAPLVNAVRSACDRGAAVVWITPSQRLWRDPSIPVTRRVRLARNALVAEGLHA